jgi:hypothetical protein
MGGPGISSGVGVGPAPLAPGKRGRVGQLTSQRRLLRLKAPCARRPPAHRFSPSPVEPDRPSRHPRLFLRLRAPQPGARRRSPSFSSFISHIRCRDLHEPHRACCVAVPLPPTPSSRGRVRGTRDGLTRGAAAALLPTGGGKPESHLADDPGSSLRCVRDDAAACDTLPRHVRPCAEHPRLGSAAREDMMAGTGPTMRPDVARGGIVLCKREGDLCRHAGDPTAFSAMPATGDSENLRSHKARQGCWAQDDDGGHDDNHETKYHPTSPLAKVMSFSHPLGSAAVCRRTRRLSWIAG